MLFWLLIAALASLAGLWVAWPFLRGGSIEMDDGDGAISVYRDQLDELDRDRAAGMISEEECEQARREIERRALNAARRMGGGFSVSQRSIAGAGALAAVAAALAIAGYALTGVPTEPDQPLAARKTEVLEQRAAAGDVNSQIALLIEQTEANPDSFDDWWTLAQSYSAIGNHSAAVEAYRKAVELGGDKPSLLSAYAEAMTLANGNKVPDAARLIFEQVLNQGPDVRARYYVALSKAQAQQFDAALEDWAALARDSQPDAPWMPLLRRDIVNMARFLKVDVALYLPDATLDEIAQSGGALLPGGAAPAVPDATDRIATLEAALAEDAFDHEAWIELATLLAAQGDDAAALDALTRGRQAYAAAPFVLSKFEETARQLGLDLLAAPGAVGGPSQDDIAAASELTDAERDDMIDGMVAGLAAKLEETPDNPEGWIMLVRSYVVMGEQAKARDALSRATEHFAENAPVLDRLQSEAASVLAQ